MEESKADAASAEHTAPAILPQAEETCCPVSSAFPWKAAWGLVALGFAIRFIHLLQRPYVMVDEVFYLETARRLARHGAAEWAGYGFPPLLPTVLAAGETMGFSGETVGNLFCITIGALVVLPIAAIAWHVTGNKKTTLLAALFMAIQPYVAHYSTAVLRDTPYSFFVALTVLGVVLTARKQYFRGTLLLTFAVPLGLLTRYEGIELFLLPIVWIPAAFLLNPGERLKTSSICVGQVALVALMIAVTVWPTQRYLARHGSPWQFWAKGKINMMNKKIGETDIDDAAQQRSERLWGPAKKSAH